MSKYEENIDATEFDQSSLNLTTNALFARVGFDYEFNKNIYVTAAYDYALALSGSEDVTGNISGVDFTATFETEKMSKFGISLGYKF